MMLNKTLKVMLLAGGLGIAQSSLAIPINASFSGNFEDDDDLELINFTADGVSEVFILSYAYGGGTNANGTVFGVGGFDPILSLFEFPNGPFITGIDNGSPACFDAAESLVPGINSGNTDPGTGGLLDNCFSGIFAAGTYTAVITQYDNEPIGPNISDGFTELGDSNFTSSFGCFNGMFCDFFASNRTSAWAYDILNVTSAEIPGQVTDVPVPQTLALFGLGLMGISLTRRKRSFSV